MNREIAPKRRQQLIRLLALASIGAGFLTCLQLLFPLKDFIWDFLWLIYLGLAEWIGDPLLKKVKFWKRLLWALGAIAVVLTFTLWLTREMKQYGINQFYVAPVPWFLLGLTLLVWSLLIRNDTLPE